MSRTHVALALALSLTSGLASTACEKEDTKEKLDAGDKTDSGTNDAGKDGGAGTGPVSFGHGPALGPNCDGKVKPGVSGALPTFERKTILDQPGAAYMKPADLNADGYPELLLTTLAEGLDSTVFPPISSGGAYVISRKGGKATGSLGEFEATTVFNRDSKVEDAGEMVGVGFPNESELIDVDNDGVLDWLIGAGFLPKPRGLLVWMKGKRDGSFDPPKKTIPVPDKTCWYHLTLPTDMDGDGDEDFVTTCHISETGNPFVESRLEWFENPGDDSGVFKHHAIGAGGGALLTLHDIDEDGDIDILAPQFFDPDGLVWWEQTGEKGSAWTRHLINVSTGRGFITQLADMNGDGRLDVLYGNHNNEIATNPLHRTMGIYWWEIPSKDTVRDLENWDATMHVVYEGFEVDGDGDGDRASAPGMIQVGDIDGDCDMDVSASGDGDLGLYLFVQQESSFEKIELHRDPLNVNSGEQHMLDMDGDGDLDLVWAIFGPQVDPAAPAEMRKLYSRVDVFLQQ